MEICKVLQGVCTSATDLIMTHNLLDDEQDSGSSPELWLPSEPVIDPYSTDEENQTMVEEKKNLFISADRIDSHSVSPWETQYFLHVDYSNEASLVEQTDALSTQNLLANALHFVNPAGVPSGFFDKYWQKNGGSKDWETVAAGIADEFFNGKQEKFKWLRDNFTADYTLKNEDGGDGLQTEQILSQTNTLRNMTYDKPESDPGDPKSDSGDPKSDPGDPKSDPGDPESDPGDPESDPGEPESDPGEPYPLCEAVHLVHRIDSAFRDAVFDPQVNSNKREHRAKQRQLLKGVLGEIFSFSGVPVMYSENLDFHYNGIPARDGDVLFTVRPDFVPWHYSYMDVDLEPWCTVQVYSPASKTLENIIASDTSRSQEANNTNIAALKHEVKSLSLVENKSVKQHGYEERSESEILFYADLNAHEKMNSDISSTGPVGVSMNSDLDRAFYGQLTMEMYGVLVNKHQLLRKSYYYTVMLRTDPGLKLGTLGMFVLNGNVYLAKMALSLAVYDRITKCLPISKGPEVVYAKHCCFNLKKPRDRLALVMFLRYMLRYRLYLREVLSRPEQAVNVHDYITTFSQKSTKPNVLW